MPIILALDAATEACSVALLHHDNIDVLFEVAPQQHSEIMLPMVKALLEKHQLHIKNCDAIAFGVGPGSFTGLRIAAGVAQGLALAYQKPLIAISDLAALAWQGFEQCPDIEFCVPALDARMQEIYLGAYQKQQQQMISIFEDCLIKPELLEQQVEKQLQQKSWFAIGSGWENYQEQIGSLANPPRQLIQQAYPSAKAIAALAKVAFENQQFLSCEDAQPHYIRDQVVHQK